MEATHATATAPSKAKVLTAVYLAVFLIVVDASVLNVAVPTLARELGADNQALQWIVDSYTLVFAGLLLTFGSLGDRFGHRKLLLGGIAVFMATSLGAAFAQSTGQLIAGRAAMGVGAAMIFPATLAVLNHRCRGPELAKAVALWAAVYGLALTFGPIIGGVLLDHFWWGSIFLVHVPVCIVLAVLVVKWVPESLDPNAERTDWLGAGLSIAAVALLVGSIIEAPTKGWTSAPILGGFAAAAFFLALFVAWEHRCDAPMLRLTFFRNRRFTAGCVVISLAFMLFMGWAYLGTQYLQFIRGYSPTLSGISLLPVAIGIASVTRLSPKLVARFGMRPVITIGLVIICGGLAGSSTITASTPFALVALYLFTTGLGLGLVQPPATEAILHSLPVEHSGIGSALNDTTRQIGAALGFAVAGSLMASVYLDRVRDALAATPAPPEAVKAASGSVAGAHIVADRAVELYGPAAGQLVRRIADAAFLDGYHLANQVSAAVALVVAVVAFVLIPSGRPGASDDTDISAEDGSTDDGSTDSSDAPVPA